MFDVKNENAMTLVEVLAATIILSFIAIGILVVLVNGNNTSNKQMKSSIQLSEVTYTLDLLTRDARKTNQLDTSIQDKYIFENTNNAQKYTYIFNKSNYTLTRNNEVIASNILNFSINNSVIRIETTNNKIFESTIYTRR